MHLTNVMKYHFAKAVVFSFFKQELLTFEEYKNTIKNLEKLYGIIK